MYRSAPDHGVVLLVGPRGVWGVGFRVQGSGFRV